MDFYSSSKSLRQVKEAGIIDNFKIIIFDESISCTNFVAAFISPRISKLIRTEPTKKKFRMKFESESEFYSSIDELKGMIKRVNFISQLNNFLQGLPFHFDSNTDKETGEELSSIKSNNAITAKLLIEFGKVFENDEMIEEGIKELLFRQDEKEMTIEKAINTIKMNQKYKIKGEVGKIPYEFYSSHFYLIYNQKAVEEKQITKSY